ncbi:hypothetical protein EZV62_007532 [Acer yangbiense]|uniref:Uncharacterized protein n=1 Tax=Acer yangbiense TaxID=1000413 RepID=A0A5C7IAN8_9ROSI|nr:hypothetical protein EZV62_007532 [Acer yangbiense]
MEYPHGHHSYSSHHSYQRNDQDEDERPPLGSALPPPSHHRQNEFDAPPPLFSQQPSYYRQNEFEAPPPAPPLCPSASNLSNKPTVKVYCKAEPNFSLTIRENKVLLSPSDPSDHFQLIPYNPDILDQSVLWTISKDTGEGYRAIRMVNNIRLNMDTFNGNKKHGDVHDGTTIIL